MLTKFNLILAIAVMACCTEVNAQGCGCGGDYGYASVAMGGYGGFGGGSNNCGRDISQGDAAALWSNYCTESCTDHSGGGLFSRLKAKCGGGLCGGGGFGGGHCGGGGFGGGFGYGGGSCGCDQGCFGYPAGGCGGGCGGGGCGGGGCLAGKFGGGRHGRGCGGCGLKGRHGGGGSCDSCPCGAAPVEFAGGCDTCGCSGDGSYFSQPVGYDYGTAGMHSVVQGCATGACGGM